MIQSYNRGTKYLERKKLDKALACYKQCARSMDFKELWLNMGNVYRLLDLDDEAARCYLRAADTNTPFLTGEYGPYDLALGNLGLLEYTYGRDDRAIAYYLTALELNPQHWDSVWNYSTALLRKYCSGEPVDVVSAWKLYEFRSRRSGALALDSSLPLWDGVSTGDHILVLCEQGVGDQLQFGRYLACLKPYFKKITVHCVPDMMDIFSDYETTEYVVDADFSIPICSLARYFDLVPGDWLRDKFKAGGKGGLIVEWAGNPGHNNDRNRSCLPEYFLDLPGTKYNLRPGAKVPRGITGVGCSTWAETASWLLSADLVISVDTSLVHMCGALGVECWLLQPLKETDFRWGRSGLNNIWYDSVKVIRNPHSWKSVFAEVKERYDTRS